MFKNKKKIIKNCIIILGIIFILIIIAQIIFSIFIKSIGGQHENIVKNSPDIGRTLNFNLPLAYSRDCTGCGGTKRSLEINQDLYCIEEIMSPHLFKNNFPNVSYVPSNTTFEIVEIIEVEPYGLQSAFSSGYTLAILKDENNLTSTILLDYLDEENICLNGMTPHIEKLFRFIENSKKAKILLTVYDLRLGVSDEETQEFTLNALKKASLKYKLSNIELTSSEIPNMLGISVEVNADSLVYLVASRLDFKIWEITGLDFEYKSLLTQEDISKIRPVPINYKNQ